MKPIFVAIALSAALTVTACGGDEPAAVVEEGVVPGIEITNARMVLAPVAGNPAAIYFDASYTGDRGVSIKSADVEGADSAELHATMEYNFETTMGPSGPVALVSGEPVKFEPGGRHIMAFNVAETVSPGTTTTVTLNIAGGKTHKFDAEVRGAGEER